MNITEELRKYANELDTAASMMSEHGFSPVAMKLTAIADRIDAEHESACAEAYGNGVMSVPIALDESAWVKLPKDADGEYIRVGERVQLIGNDPGTVTHMSLADDGWRVYVKYDGGIGTGSGEPKRIRHYHAPTVEDVLREFAQEMSENLGMYTGEAIDADEWRDADAKTIAEYAAKLRLAGDDE